MNRIKITDNFYLDEFVNPDTYKRFGIDSRRYLRTEIINISQYLREQTGLSITVNNWAVGGQYKESGLRDVNTVIGAKYSAHKFGAGADLKIGKMSSFEMVEVLIEHEQALLKLGLTRYENPEATQGNTDWMHLDCLWTGSDRLLMINP